MGYKIKFFWVNKLHKEWVEDRAMFTGIGHRFVKSGPGANTQVEKRYVAKWGEIVDFWILHYVGFDNAEKERFEAAMEPFIDWIDERRTIESGNHFDMEELARGIISPVGLTYEEFMAANPLPIYNDVGTKVVGRRILPRRND
jgi:hypothetical protein